MHPDTVLVVNTILTECYKVNMRPRPMKLQKLLYLAFGHYLIKKSGARLIGDDFEAWPYGCVVPSVYHSFKHYGYRRIDCMLLNSETKKAYIINWKVDPAKYTVIQDVLSRYGDKSDMELSDLNHREGTAWWKARKARGEGRQLIKIEDIKDEFKNAA